MFLQILHGKPCGSIFDKLLVHAFKTTHGSTKLLSKLLSWLASIFAI